jgi:cell division protein FtsB
VAGKTKATPGQMVVRAIIAIIGISVIVFAVQGGEWGTVDLIKQTSRLARVKHQVDSLNHEVDSLKKYKQLLQTDPVTQEKIAREEFGMVKKGNKEILYRYTDSDSAARKAGAGKKP